MNCIQEAVVIFVVWINDCFCSCNLLWERIQHHHVCTVDVNVYPEFKDVVQDVNRVMVVVLSRHCHSMEEMSDPSASKSTSASCPVMTFCRILWINMILCLMVDLPLGCWGGSW